MELKVKQYNDNASMSLDIELNNGSHCATQYVSLVEDRVKLAVDLLKGAYEVLASAGLCSGHLYEFINELDEG